MKKRRFPMSVRFLLFVPILVTLLVVAQGTPGQVQAGEYDDDTFACWASGPLSENDYDWGEDDEFVVDWADLGEDYRSRASLSTDSLEDEHHGKWFGTPSGLTPEETKEWEYAHSVYTLFDTVPELVEYAFALDVFDTNAVNGGDWPIHLDRDISDRRVRMLAKAFVALDYDVGSGEDKRILLPWQEGEVGEYLKRRTVGAYYPVVKSFSAEWIDPANPDGGRAVDAVALAQDHTSDRLEQVEGTITTAGDGGVSHYGTTEGIGQQVSFQTKSTCGANGVCVEESNYVNDPVPITLHSNIRAQNDGEIDRNTTVKDSRRMRVLDSVDDDGVPIFTEGEYEFDPAHNKPSTMRSRDSLEGGYSRMHQDDTNSDELRVSLVLDDKYRRDIEDYQPDLGGGVDLSPRGLPIMGFKPWTYDFIHTTRDPEVNEWVQGGKGDPSITLLHKGYRQPGLDRPPLPFRSSGALTRSPGGMRRWHPNHIRWPVNFEDISWYLYALPTDEYRGALWLYWLTEDGTKRTVFSAYGKDAIKFSEDDNRRPLCKVKGAEDSPVDQSREPLNASKIDCEAEVKVDWEFDDLFKGQQAGLHLPFDVEGSAEAHLLGPDLLVKQGVERAEDVYGPKGTRKLNRFDFSILESQRMGEVPPEQEGYDAERIYGIPRDSGFRDKYLAEWAFKPVDPNMSHLLVFTFYEVQHEGDQKFKIHDADLEVLKLPKRRIRRVICRAMIHPSGFNPSTGESKFWYEKVWDAAKGVFDKVELAFGGWLSKILAAIAEFPLMIGIIGSELACGGLGKLDDLTSLGDVSGPSPPALVDQEGRIRVNAAVVSKMEGARRCHRISSPPVSTCQQDADLIFQGKCARLPELKLNVHAAEFIRPPEPEDPALEYNEYRVEVPPDSYYAEHSDPNSLNIVNAVKDGFDRPKFHPVANLTLDPPPELNNRNRGLTRVFLDWELRWDTSVGDDLYDRVNGFVVVLHPDQKSVSFPVSENGVGFYLPEWAYYQFLDDGHVYRTQHLLDGFAVGGLGYYPEDSDRAGPNSDVFVHATGSRDDSASVNPLGSSELVVGHYDAFRYFVHNMPLAPGFTHGFQVAPYSGVPGDPAFRLGPLSEILWLVGDDVACDYVTEPEEDVADIRKLHDCRGGGARVHVGYTDDEFRPGLLALTGTDICDDIFSSTPAGFTWDNPVVKKVWGLMWIISGALLFTLLVWQGLRMTYDIWLDPQPAIGFRELVPRFLMAVLLAWGSLVICRMVLVVASDLTCFVAQFTGMSMWGVVGVTFGVLVDGYMAWYKSFDSSGDTFLFLLSNFLLIFVFGGLVLLVFLYLLYLFAKVVLAMLMRIALLAVLVTLSPLAFAFYASDATAHWTKRWLSMFLGATFQQVVVLLVIYIGISMIGGYLSSGAETGLTSLLVGMILTFITLSLATAVPDLVNPGGKSLFSSFTQMASMTLAAGMVIASAGVGSVVGGLSAVGAAAGGGPSPAPGGPGSGGPAAPPPAGPPPATPAGGGGLISSVHRNPMGPAVTGPAVTGPAVTGPAVTGPAAPGPAAPGPAVTGPAVTGPAAPGPDVTGPDVTGPAAPGPDVTGPSAPRQQGPGLLSRVASGVGRGWVSGARWGAGMNVRASNLASGRSFYRHSSRGDDSADQVERLRGEMSEDRVEMRNFYRRIANSLDPEGNGPNV